MSLAHPRKNRRGGLIILIQKRDSGKSGRQTILRLNAGPTRRVWRGVIPV
jgi:hypothetical protein